MSLPSPPDAAHREHRVDQGRTGDLIFERRGDILWALFNRAHARNALTWAMYDALAGLRDHVNADRSVRAVVLAGMGQTFAAGTDIAQFRAFNSELDAREYEAHGNEVMDTLESLRVPLVAALAGACTGAGAIIACCADVRIVARSTRFGVPIARTLGNCLSHQNYVRLVSLIGYARTSEILTTGRLMDADELRAAGAASEVVPDERLDARAQELAESIAANAPLTLRATRQALLRIRRQLLPQEDDVDLMRMCYQSHDFHEGVDAFLQKRKPEWRGE